MAASGLEPRRICPARAFTVPAFVSGRPQRNFRARWPRNHTEIHGMSSGARTKPRRVRTAHRSTTKRRHGGQCPPYGHFLRVFPCDSVAVYDQRTSFVAPDGAQRRSGASTRGLRAPSGEAVVLRSRLSPSARPGRRLEVLRPGRRENVRQQPLENAGGKTRRIFHIDLLRDLSASVTSVFLRQPQDSWRNAGLRVTPRWAGCRPGPGARPGRAFPAPAGNPACVPTR